MAALIRTITQFHTREIDELWKKARRVVKHDGLHLLKAPRSQDVARILIVIPKKVGSAPQRNKIRRQIRHLFYEQKLYERNFDWIAIVKPQATGLSYQQLLDLFAQAHDKQ